MYTIKNLNFINKVTTFLVVTFAISVCYFAYLSISSNLVSSNQLLAKNNQQLALHFENELDKLTSDLQQLLTNLANNQESAQNSLTSKVSSNLFAHVSFHYSGDSNFSENANVSNIDIVYGNAVTWPTINSAQATRLRQGEVVLITQILKSELKLFLAQGLASNTGYVLAELKQDKLLNKLGSDTHIIYLNGQLNLVRANNSSGLRLLQYIEKHTNQRSGSVNGFQYNTHPVNLLDGYGYSVVNAISVEEKPAFYQLLINSSKPSLLTFLSILLLFCAQYFKGFVKHKIKVENLQSKTIPLDQRFSYYLEAVSNIDKAVLSGINAEEIAEIGLKQLQKVLKGDFIGISLLPSKTIKDPKTTLLHSNNHLSKLHLKIDKNLTKHLSEFKFGSKLIISSDSFQHFDSIAPEARELLLHPIYKEGVLLGFMFFAPHNQAINDMHNHCLSAIAQHISVAFTTVTNNEKLYVKEYFDPVTELYNQQACRERLSQELASARRKKGKVAVFHIKLLGYKKINETFGYSLGDQLLKQAGERLKSNLRDSDILARLGADDFIVATSDISIITNANRLADKVSNLFNDPIQIFDNSFNLSTAIGISVFPTDGITVEEILNHANAAMNKAKTMGNGHYAFYEDNLSTNEMWRINLDKELRTSLKNAELFMFYQAQLNPRNKKICGVEALLRWKHPTRGLINPAEFIQLAEETGLIVNLGQYARESAFNQYMKWLKMGCAPERISVNVSSYEMQRQEFVNELKATIKNIGISPKAIELEITESLLLEVSGNVINNLKQLNELGVMIAIDDFGTGYSNLSYLGRLPFDVLKIDKSFMHGIGLQSSANQVVGMMIDMAHHLGKSVCAEGVESEIQYKFLETAGCDVLQGYLISKPVPASEFEKLALEYLNKKLNKKAVALTTAS
jgi:diguanylate cyclase (GGDEF)-like protein